MANRAERLPEPMSADEFIRWMATWSDADKWELHHGVPVAMAGGTDVHDAIAVNLTLALAPVRQRGCHIRRDTLLRRADDDTFGAFPDLYVRCGPPNGSRTWNDDPTIIVEVLSPSTMRIDRGYKLDQYMAFPTLRYYIIVYPGEFRVEMWSRDGEGQWINDPTVRRSLGEVLELPEYELAIPMTAIYADTELAAAAG